MGRRKLGEMKMEKRALGKGLAALIGEKQAQDYKKPVPLFMEKEVPKTKGEVFYLEVEKITPSKFQPREHFDDEKLKELIASIKEKGLLQPILVRKSDSGFEIIAGERRFRAAKALSVDKIPVIVKEVKDHDALVISLMENIQREGLNPIESARAFQRLLDKFNFSQDEIAKALGKDKATVSNILRLLKLPEDIQRYLVKGQITFGHAKVLLETDDIKKQHSLCHLIISNSLSVRELENMMNAALPQRKRKTAISATTDPYVLNLESQLQHSLGTKVRIIAHRKRGKIIIEYYSPQDLERVVNILRKKP